MKKTNEQKQIMIDLVTLPLSRLCYHRGVHYNSLVSHLYSLLSSLHISVRLITLPYLRLKVHDFLLNIFFQTDPNNVNLGVGLGLPGIKPGIENKALVANALINRSPFLHRQIPQTSPLLLHLVSPSALPNLLKSLSTLRTPCLSTPW